MKKLLILLAFVVFIFLSVFLSVNLIKVRKITCVSQKGECNKNLQLEINTLQDKNILTTSNSLNRLLNKNPKILEYSIAYVPLSNFKVNVIERFPIVAFSLKNGQFALVDKDGTILDEVKSTSLPELTSYYNLSKDELVFVANLMNSLYTFYSVKKAIVTADGLEINNIRAKNVIFPLSGDKEALLGSLNLILSRLPSVEEASTIVTIDLRFKNPVLK